MQKGTDTVVPGANCEAVHCSIRMTGTLNCSFQICTRSYNSGSKDCSVKNLCLDQNPVRLCRTGPGSAHKRAGSLILRTWLSQLTADEYGTNLHDSCTINKSGGAFPTQVTVDTAVHRLRSRHPHTFHTQHRTLRLPISVDCSKARERRILCSSGLSGGGDRVGGPPGVICVVVLFSNCTAVVLFRTRRVK